jgi:hypothetical protein
MKSCERLAHITNYIFAQGYLPCKARSLVSWKGACGKHIEECARVEDVLSWGEGLCEEKPLRLVIGEYQSMEYMCFLIVKSQTCKGVENIDPTTPYSRSLYSGLILSFIILCGTLHLDGNPVGHFEFLAQF